MMTSLAPQVLLIPIEDEPTSTAQFRADAAGTIMRRAQVKDAHDIAAAQVEIWRRTYSAIARHGQLERMTIESREKLWRSLISTSTPGTVILVAEDAVAGIVGFLSCGPSEGPMPEYGDEIYAINLRPSYQRRGIGRQLLLCAFEQMLTIGNPRAWLSTLNANGPSQRFFEKMGGVKIGDSVDRAGGLNLPQIVYGWNDLSQLVRPARRLL